MALRRSILRYLPAALLVIFMIPWGISYLCSIAVYCPPAARPPTLRPGVFLSAASPAQLTRAYSLNDGLVQTWLFYEGYHGQFRIELGGEVLRPRRLSEMFVWDRWMARFPLDLPVVALLPLAVGCLTGFRFRIWHYFVYTVVIAIAVAF